MKTNKNKCFCCLKIKKLSEEHIIPQALGGRLTDWIYCEDCNKQFGGEIDSELTKRIGFFGTALNIKRNRGKNQPYEVTSIKDGSELMFDGQGFRRKNPKICIENDGKKIKHIDVTARDEDELKQIFANLKSKYDLPDEIQFLEEKHAGPTDTTTEFVFDNKKIRRAVSKIAYSLICVKLPKDLVLSSSFDEIRNYILNGANFELASANYVHTDFMTDFVRPLHKVHICSSKSRNLLYGFICLFGTFRYTILLSRNFESILEFSDIDHTINPVTSKYIDGNPFFIAPQLDTVQIISPKNTKQQVIEGLSIGFKILSTYINGNEFLKIDIE